MTEININQRQTALLSGLTPGHHSLENLQEHLAFLMPTDTDAVPKSFDNLVLFKTDTYRSDSLNYVDVILAKYNDAVFEARCAEAARIEKDLLWSALQLYARLQAIHHDVGLILEPKTEYADCLTKLNRCTELLEKNQSHHIAKGINQLLLYAAANAEIKDCWEQFVARFVDLRQWESFFSWFINQIDRRNETRLFWVWGRPNVELILGWFGQQEAQSRLADTKTIPGQISWSLYLFRGSLFFLKYMHKRMNEPKWLQAMESLSAEERAKYRAQYIKAYWDVYKYRILNDYVWGPINLVCFKWWTGWAGDFATCFLLCMDIYLSDLTYTEGDIQYKAIQEKHAQRLAALSDDIEAHRPGFVALGIEEALKTLNEELEHHQNPLLRQLILDWMDVYHVKQQHHEHWVKKSQFLQYDRLYTKALLGAFFICVSLLIPGMLPASLSVFLSSGGTILCMALTIVYRTARVGLKTTHSQKEISTLRGLEQDYFNQFLTLKSAQHPLDDATKSTMKRLYLDLITVGGQITLEHASIQYERLELARTTFLRVFVPTLIGVTSVCLPATLPLYMMVLAVSAVLAYGLDVLVRQYKPEDLQPSSASWDEHKYRRFYQAPIVFGRHPDGLFARSHTQVQQSDSVALLPALS
ncbi:MAG: hypothetical protein CK424_00655 [Legionella sp.]|nr:MAG: hypothetical protein CK424_00655 [Legionella sp.]